MRTLNTRRLGQLSEAQDRLDYGNPGHEREAQEETSLCLEMVGLRRGRTQWHSRELSVLHEKPPRENISNCRCSQQLKSHLNLKAHCLAFFDLESVLTLHRNQLQALGFRLRSSARARHVGNTRVFFLWTERWFSSRRSLNQCDGVHWCLFTLGCPAPSKLSALHDKTPRGTLEWTSQRSGVFWCCRYRHQCSWLWLSALDSDWSKLEHEKGGM